METSAQDVTTLLNLLGDDPEAEEKLFRSVESRFRKIAAGRMAGQAPGHTLQETVLVDDAFWKLVRGKNVVWEDREQFFGMAARIMRQLLVDHARKRLAAKRGHGDRPASLHGSVEPEAAGTTNPERMVMLDEILSRLETEHPEIFSVFHLHYFGGWGLEEIAEDILDMSLSTIKRRWQMAKGFLRREFDEGNGRNE